MISRKTLLYALVRLGLAALVIAAIPSDAQALCAAQQMEGTWRNANSLTTGITRIQITFPCNDTRPSNPAPPTIRVWGKCSPTDCDWGTEEIICTFFSEAAGQYTHIVAVYNHGYAERSLEAYLLDDGRLFLSNETTFTDGRRDYSKGEFFVK
jgi:hypothetical protein